MDKRRLHHLQTRLRWLKPWYFLILALISALICVFALRANNQQMIRLRQAVYIADRDNTDVQGALRQLQTYVTAHMNTNLATANNVYPPIQLKHTYDRLVATQNQQAGLSNSQIYSAAQAYCEGQNGTDFSGRNRVSCIEQYVKSYNLKQVKIPDALYKFSFVSPRWSPDLAGWSLLAALLFGLLFAVTGLGKLWLKRASK